ncbi:MAG: DEAD/DEAH box helicase [Ruminococcus sp.]|nr:DEAD/DEAH box helicase [Ruminococcus sp.]
MNFYDINLSSEIVHAIEDMGFTEMTEIQYKSIPLLLDGRDVIGRSNTGTGKTIAFGIPAIMNIDSNNCQDVKSLILCPTRELAIQCCDEIKKLSKYMKWIKPCAIYGGASMENQIRQLKRGANVIVGTPGRVIDHINRKTLRLDSLSSIILDEADEMLNMGFREDIETILESVPEERQTVLFSATMPKAILDIATQYQTDPIMVKTENSEKSVDNIEQYWFDIPMGRKTDALVMLLFAYSPKSSMVFCNTKKTVDDLTEALTSKGINAIGLHGDMKQLQRTQVMNAFKKGNASVLIATDVAARGIDVDGIDIVFNYDIPQDIEYYTHRIGRTGRAGKSGKAYTLVTGRKQIFALKDIARLVKANIKEITMPTRNEICESRCNQTIDSITSDVKSTYDSNVYNVYDRLMENGLSPQDVALCLIDGMLSKQLENIPELDIPQPLKKRKNADGSNVKTVKIDISVGRNHKIAPNFILGALVDATGMSGKNFGKIDIFDSHTTVEVPKESQDFVIDSMSGGKINGNKVTVRLYDYKSKDKNRDRKRYNYTDTRKSKRLDDFYNFDKSNTKRTGHHGGKSNRRGKNYNSKG